MSTPELQDLLQLAEYVLHQLALLIQAQLDAAEVTLELKIIYE